MFMETTSKPPPWEKLFTREETYGTPVMAAAQWSDQPLIHVDRQTNKRTDGHRHRLNHTLLRQGLIKQSKFSLTWLKFHNFIAQYILMVFPNTVHLMQKQNECYALHITKKTAGKINTRITHQNLH